MHKSPLRRAIAMLACCSGNNSLKYPSAAGADPVAVAKALLNPGPRQRRLEESQEQYEAVARDLDKAQGPERARLKRRLFELAGVPDST